MRAAAPLPNGSPWPTHSTSLSSSARRRKDDPVLFGVEQKARPSQLERRPGADRVAGDQRAPLLPVEGEVAGRMPRRMHDPHRTDHVAIVDKLVHLSGRMLDEPEVVRHLERPGAHGWMRQPRHLLRRPIARDQVSLPLVRVNGRAAQLLQQRQSAQVRAVRVRHDDPLEILDRLADLRDLIEDALGVRVVEGIDERQLFAVVEQVGMHIGALLLPQAVDSGCDFHLFGIASALISDLTLFLFDYNAERDDVVKHLTSSARKLHKALLPSLTDSRELIMLFPVVRHYPFTVSERRREHVKYRSLGASRSGLRGSSLPPHRGTSERTVALILHDSKAMRRRDPRPSWPFCLSATPSAFQSAWQ